MSQKSDPLNVLLEHRNTLRQGMTYFPAQSFLCRRAKSILPVSESLLRQLCHQEKWFLEKLLDRRAKVKVQYDKTASKELAPLVPGQFVFTTLNDHHRVKGGITGR